MVDYNIDNLMKHCIVEVIKRHQSGESSSCETTWYSLTRRMFKNYPAAVIYELVERALCEASDEQWFENKYPKEVFMEMDFKSEKEKQKTERNVVVTSGITNKIIQKIRITDIAEQFGLKLKGNKTKCPFHNDTNPSLCFDDDKGFFYCHGCHQGGNIIKFYAMLKELNPNFKYKKPMENKNELAR